MKRRGGTNFLIGHSRVGVIWSSIPVGPEQAGNRCEGLPRQDRPAEISQGSFLMLPGGRPTPPRCYRNED